MALDVGVFRADFVHRLPEREAVGGDVVLRDAQVVVLFEIRLQVAFHVLPLGVEHVGDPPSILEPLKAVGVAFDEIEVTADSGHRLPEVEAVGGVVVLRHAQVAVAWDIEELLQVELHVLPLGVALIGDPPALLEPLKAVGVVFDEIEARADSVHRLPEVEAVGGVVVCRNAQVAVAVVERLQVELHVLPLGVELVLDPPSILEPLKAVGVASHEMGLRADSVNRLLEREAVGGVVVLRDAEVAVVVVERLQVSLSSLPRHLRPRLDGLPDRRRVALPADRQVEGLPDRLVGLAVLHNSSVLGDKLDLTLVRPPNRLFVRKPLRFNDACGEGAFAEGWNRPVKTEVFRLARRAVEVLSLPLLEGVLGGHPLSNDLPKVAGVEERVPWVDAVEAPLVYHRVDVRRAFGRRGANADTCVVSVGDRIGVEGVANRREECGYLGLLGGVPRPLLVRFLQWTFEGRLLHPQMFNSIGWLGMLSRLRTNLETEVWRSFPSSSSI